jgi:hypothetical protein
VYGIKPWEMADLTQREVEAIAEDIKNMNRDS